MQHGSITGHSEREIKSRVVLQALIANSQAMQYYSEGSNKQDFKSFFNQKKKKNHIICKFIFPHLLCKEVKNGVKCFSQNVSHL